MTRAMTADQFLALADTLRSYAQHAGRDTNSANLFVHTVLMRAIKHDGRAPPQRETRPEKAAA